MLLLGYHYYSCREGITLFNTEMVISRQMIGFTIRILLLLIVTARMYAAGVDGIWTGQTPGRNGEVQDISFQFRLNGNTLTGKMFGDEFDLPIEEEINRRAIKLNSRSQPRTITTATKRNSSTREQFGATKSS